MDDMTVAIGLEAYRRLVIGGTFVWVAVVVVALTTWRWKERRSS